MNSKLLFGSALIVLIALSGTAAAKDRTSEADFEGAAAMRDGGLATAGARYGVAAEAYEQAGRRLRDTWFDDDADLLRILAVAASGDDEEAAKLDRKWRRKHGDGPLAAEAGLARAWNLVRRGAIEKAREEIGKTLLDHEWLAADGRCVTLQAAIDFASGDPASARKRLTADETIVLPALGELLLGRCLEGAGDDRAAALAYRRLLANHPDSPLRGWALLAKGRIFDLEEDFRDAVTEFDALAAFTSRTDLRAQARFLGAACRFLGGDHSGGIDAMTTVARDYTGQDTAARAHFALGEMRWLTGDYEIAISHFNEVLASYFDDRMAGSALYRTGRCLDALGRTNEANGAYQAVAQGHPYAPEAPAAVYLAGVGLLEQGNPRAAAPYFQLVMDRYAGQGATFVFESPEHQELVEASLCLLEYSYHLTDQLGAMSGAPHLALQKMPPSRSIWRAYALLLDADALAAQARLPEAQDTLATLLREFPDHSVGIRANRLLAWTYARQGRQDLAIETERRMLARYDAQHDETNLSAAQLTMAHSLFNTKDFQGAADAYGEFLRAWPAHEDALTARYQQGICYQRLGRDGDAVDAWETITAAAPAAPEARQAWLRAGDVYFQAGHFADARRCFESVATHFDDDATRAGTLLRLGRCDFNEGKNTDALARFRSLRADYPASNESHEVEQDLTQVLYTLGLAGDEAALEDLAARHADSPLAPEARFELAMNRYDAGEYAAAGELFADLAGRYPGYTSADRATFLAAECREKTGDTAGARAAWDRFLAYFPDSDLEPTARFRGAALRFADGEYVAAASDFQRVLDSEASDEIHGAALYNLALCRRIQGHDAEAKQALIDYRSRGYGGASADRSSDPARDIQIARMLGEIHEQAHRYAAAAGEYRRAVELGAGESEAVELNYLAGMCLDKAGDRPGALGAFARSIACGDKTNTFRLSALAQSAALHEEGSDWNEALAAYRDLIRHTDDAALAGAAQQRIEELEDALGH